jgi:hypothetical protein
MGSINAVVVNSAFRVIIFASACIVVYSTGAELTEKIMPDYQAAPLRYAPHSERLNLIAMQIRHIL